MVTTTASAASERVSASRLTRIVLDVSPGAKVSVPSLCTKSEPASANSNAGAGYAVIPASVK